MHAPRLLPFRLLISIPLALPIAACGGGGGGSGNAGVGERYDIDSFGYQDPYAPDFQPLGSTAFRIARREELAVLAATGSGTGHAVALDDAGQQFRQLSPFGPSLFTAGFVAAASACGNVDAVAGDELAVIGMRGSDLEVALLGADSGGQWTVLASFLAATALPALANVVIEVADLDGDEPEEILVAATNSGGGGFVRVFDDAQAGFVLRHNLDVGGCNLLQVVPRDFDGDGAQEILVFSREAQRALVGMVEGGRKQFAFRGEWVDLDPATRKIVVGNFDRSDPAPELAALQIAEIPGNGLRFYCRCYDQAAGGWQRYSSSPLDWDAYPPTEVLDAVACDLDGDHVDEIVSVLQYGSPSRAVVRLWSCPTVNTHFDVRQILSISTTPQRVALAALDTDADALEEVALVYGSSGQSLFTKLFGYPKRPSGNNELTWHSQTTAPCAAGTVSALVAAGDFDRENAVLRSTGRKWLDLAEPMPIALLAAPPTRAGIGQNRDASATAYGTQQSIEHTHGVSTGWTASFSVGMEVSSVFDLFSASVKQTLSVQMEQTLKSSQKVTWTKTFTGSHDQDVIVFQGTLYQVYEYEILSAANPALVGGKVTLNDPVATRTYKWTLDFYNQTVPERARIGTDVVTHTVGDPASYRRKSAAASLLHARYGWIDDVGLEVGQGAGSNATSVTITTGNSTEESRRFGIDWESEIKVGGPTIGGSFGLSAEEIYGVTVEEGTTYQGQVGDIQGSAQWGEWRYSFGLLVYRHGAGATGAPERGARPFHVVTYWVDQLGPGYPGP